MQKTFFASKGRNFFTKTQLRRAHLRAARPAVAATAAQAAGRRPEKRTSGIGSRTAYRSGLAAAESRADRFACTGGTFSSHYAPPPTHYNDCRRHAADGPAGRGLPSAKAGSAKRFCGMPIRKCGLVRRRSAALPGSHGRSAPKTPEASGASPTASDGYAERSCAGIAFLRSVELIPARRAGVPVRDGAGEGARRRGSAGGARDQTSRSSSDVSCDGWASDSSS